MIGWPDDMTVGWTRRVEDSFQFNIRKNIVIESIAVAGKRRGVVNIKAGGHDNRSDLKVDFFFDIIIKDGVTIATVLTVKKIRGVIKLLTAVSGCSSISVYHSEDKKIYILAYQLRYPLLNSNTAL